MPVRSASWNFWHNTGLRNVIFRATEVAEGTVLALDAKLLQKTSSRLGDDKMVRIVYDFTLQDVYRTVTLWYGSQFYEGFCWKRLDGRPREWMICY